eukprot:3854777-Pyramimonas_sp.AAC.1
MRLERLMKATWPHVAQRAPTCPLPRLLCLVASTHSCSISPSLGGVASRIDTLCETGEGPGAPALATLLAVQAPNPAICCAAAKRISMLLPKLALSSNPSAANAANVSAHRLPSQCMPSRPRPTAASGNLHDGIQ